MKLPVALLAVALVVMVVGAALIGRWAVGLALMFWGGGLVVYTLVGIDVPEPRQPTVTSIDPIERWRRSS